MLNYFNPALFVALINNNDNPTLTEVLNGPDSAGFMVAMKNEINTLIMMKPFVVVDKVP